MLRLSRANVAQNEHFRFERGDVGYSRAEVLGDAVLRGHFEQSVGREVVVTRALLQKPREALRYGLIDEVCEEGMLEKRVMEIAEKMKQVPRDGYAKTKVNLRGEFAEKWYRYGMRRRGEGRFSNVVRTSHREAAKTGFRRVEKRSRSEKSVFEVVMFLSHLVLVLVVVGF